MSTLEGCWGWRKLILVLYALQKLLMQVCPVLKSYLGVLFVLWLESRTYRCINTSENRKNLNLFFTTKTLKYFWVTVHSDIMLQLLWLVL